MKFETEKLEISKVNLSRRLNYKVHDKGEQFNCVKPLNRNDFPRFHLFIKEDKDKLKFKLHLDQKRSSYGKESIEPPARPNAHSGDYEGKRVEQEAERIKRKLKNL